MSELGFILFLIVAAVCAGPGEILVSDVVPADFYISCGRHTWHMD